VGKVKFNLQLTMKAQSGSKMYISTVSLTSALDGVGGHRYTPDILLTVKTFSPCVVGWVDPRAGLDRCV